MSRPLLVSWTTAFPPMPQINETIRLDWSAPPSDPAESLQTEIHVWRASVHHFSNQLAKLSTTMSPDEADRADRFKVDAARQRFLIGRGLLRHLVSRYLYISPKEVAFAYGRFGKPSLIDHCQLEFNVAHSGDLIIYAFANCVRLGIDVEKIDPGINVLESATQFCAPSEMEVLARLSGVSRPQAFFRLWARKEAVLKATGEGFSRSPTGFDVLDGVRAADAGKISNDISSTGSLWQVRDLDVHPDYAAALICEGGHRTLRGWAADELII